MPIQAALTSAPAPPRATEPPGAPALTNTVSSGTLAPIATMPPSPTEPTGVVRAVETIELPRLLDPTSTLTTERPVSVANDPAVSPPRDPTGNPTLTAIVVTLGVLLLAIAFLFVARKRRAHP